MIEKINQIKLNIDEIFSLFDVENDTSRKGSFMRYRIFRTSASKMTLRGWEVSRDVEKPWAYSDGTISCCTSLGMIEKVSKKF